MSHITTWRSSDGSLRNRMASHIITALDNEWEGLLNPQDPCMYCCGSVSCTVARLKSKETHQNQISKGSTPCARHTIFAHLRQNDTKPNRAFCCEHCHKHIPSYNYKHNVIEYHGIEEGEFTSDETIGPEYSKCNVSVSKEKVVKERFKVRYAFVPLLGTIVIPVFEEVPNDVNMTLIDLLGNSQVNIGQKKSADQIECNLR